MVSWKHRGSFKRPDTPSPDSDLLWRSEGRRNLTHRESPKYPGEYDVQFPKGKIFDKKSFPMKLEVGKKYAFCTCGYSKNQVGWGRWRVRGCREGRESYFLSNFTSNISNISHGKCDMFIYVSWLLGMYSLN